jgi:multidrug efflux pump subunit AcrA (membrane-fusion protein)
MRRPVATHLVTAVVGLGIGTLITALALGSRNQFRGVTTQVSVTSADEKQKQLWHCGMHPQVIQDHPGECPICHMALTPMSAGRSPENSGAERKILYWWDPMLGAASISDQPGKSAMGMDLVPVYAESAGPTVIIDPNVVQNMGVRTAEVTRGPLTRSIKTVGILTLPEPGMFDVSLKVNGWIERIYANQQGMHIEKGTPLFELFSPEVLLATQELISATKAEHTKTPEAHGDVSLSTSAKRKLLLWGLTEEDVRAIAAMNEPPRTVTFRSPISGHIEEKLVVEGANVQAGMRLLRLADHTKLWLEAQVYAADIPLIKIGQEISARIEGGEDKSFAGKVSFIYPHVEPEKQTLKVRATIDNSTLKLKPGMYATAEVSVSSGSDVLLCPRSAVIDTGSKQTVFVADTNGHFSPRKVSVGTLGDNDQIAITSGLAPGEQVVISGQFLIDVESRMIEATEKLSGGRAESKTVAQARQKPALPMAATTTATSRQLTVAYCPMASAAWLQIGDEIKNPYMGQRMSDCGEIKKSLSLRASESGMGEFTDIYLKVSDMLNADKVDPKIAGQLDEAASNLPDTESSLREAVSSFSQAADLKSARTAFKSVSQELTAAIEKRGQ